MYEIFRQALLPLTSAQLDFQPGDCVFQDWCRRSVEDHCNLVMNNYQWIRDLATVKSIYLPNLQLVRIHEVGLGHDPDQLQVSWKAPDSLAELYGLHHIDLSITLRHR